MKAAHRSAAIAAASSVGVAPVPDVLQWTAAAYAAWLFLKRRRTYRLLREVKLAQLAQATTFLLGHSEPVVAGEASLYPANPILIWLLLGRFGVVVTTAMVMVLDSPKMLDPPRSVVMAARANDVQIELGRAGLYRFPALFVKRSDRVWPITGTWGVFQPEPVLQAWRRAGTSAAQLNSSAGG